VKTQNYSLPGTLKSNQWRSQQCGQPSQASSVHKRGIPNSVDRLVGPVVLANVAYTKSMESPVRPLAFADEAFTNSLDGPVSLVAFANMMF
jgi:hypothetical protein